jgi:hypothetical protein
MTPTALTTTDVMTAFGVFLRLHERNGERYCYNTPLAYLNRLTKGYKAELWVFINKIAPRTGQAAFVDDDVEWVMRMQIKPRKSKPGGSEDRGPPMPPHRPP